MFPDPHVMTLLGYAGLAIVGLVFGALTLQPAVDALPKRRSPRIDPDEHAAQPGAANLPLRDWKPGQCWTRTGAVATPMRRWDYDA